MESGLAYPKTEPCLIYQNHPVIPSTKGHPVAIHFMERGSRSYEKGRITGEGLLKLVAMPDGSYAGVFSQYASSNKWKLYSNPRTTVVFIDASGNPLHDYPYLYETWGAIDFSGPLPDERRRSHTVMVPAACKMSYVLLKFQFFGFQEGFDRQSVATTCRGKCRGKQLMNLATSNISDFPEYIGKHPIAVGTKFKFRNDWQGQRLR